MKFGKIVSGILVSIALLVIFEPINSVMALTYAEISGKVLGNATGFYPYPTGTLVNDGGTIYFISGTTKVPFTSWQAFVGLGYGSKTIVEGDLTNYYLSQGYILSSPNVDHPWGSWLVYKGTVYYSSQDGLIGVPSSQVFTSNGGDWAYIVKANSYDVAVLNAHPNLPPLTINDPRVYGQSTYQQPVVTPTPTPIVTPTPTPTPLVTPTPIISSSIRVGQIISLGNTIYLVGQNGLYGFTDVATFNSWGYNFSQLVTANSAEQVLPKLTLILPKTSGCNSPFDQIAGNCGSQSAIMAPSPVSMTGPTSVVAGTSNNYSFVSTDKSNGYDGGLLTYTIDWGDGSSASKSSSLASGVSYSISHTWQNGGSYNMTVSVVPGMGSSVVTSFQINVGINSSSSNSQLPDFYSSLGNISPKISGDSTSVEVNKEVLVQFTIYNGGIKAYAPSMEVQFSGPVIPASQNYSIAENTCSGKAWLDKGESCVYAFKVTYNQIGVGYGIKLLLDPHNNQQEQSKDNNSMLLNFNVKPGANPASSGSCTPTNNSTSPIATTNSVGSITVTSPNGGECLTKGSTKMITWTASSNIDTVSIGYSSGSSSLDWIISSTPNTGSYSWPVNVGNTSNTQFKIQIIGYQTGTGSVTDLSDSYFTVN